MTTPQQHLRIIHSSDWHIGHELAGHGREYEHDLFLAWLLDRLEAELADVLLVTGDVYDVANPAVPAMERLYRFLREATERCSGLQIVVIGGNHDSAARINLPAALLGRGRVHLVGSLPRQAGALDLDRLLVPLNGRDGKAAAWLAAVPYCRPGDLGAASLSDLYGEVLAAGAEAAKGLPLVVTGHLHVAGGDVSEDSERRIVVGGEEAEAAALFDARAAYVALGHLHRPQQIEGATHIRYAGSPFPLSATERGYNHSISIVDLAPAGATVRLEPIPRPVPFLIIPAEGAKPIAEVEAELAALALEDVERQRQPFVEVSVLVDGPEPGLQARVLAALDGKPVRLTRVVRIAARAAGPGAITARETDLAELKPEAVFAEIFASRHGGVPSDDLARAFAELLIAVEGEDS